MNISAPKVKIKAFAIVRDKDGNPKVDNPDTLPKEIIDALSEKDKAYLKLMS